MGFHAASSAGFAASLGIAATLLATPPAGAVEAALESRLRTAQPEVQRWEIRPVETSADVRAPALPIVSIGRIGPRTAVRFADGRVRWYVVAGFRPAPVSTHAVEAGDPVTADAIETAERDLIGLGCEPLAIDETTRWRAARRLAAGEAICAHNVERVPEVERDRPVTLSARHGAVRVSRVFTATTDARAGERVRLHDRATGATVTAIVTGPGTARVSEVTP
jgi:flagella basal body P-ring formation protein FlgA